MCVSVDKEVRVLHETLSVKLLDAATETESRRRQLESMRREDEAKLRAARKENEALRDELDAMIAGAKRTDVGLVIYRHIQHVFPLITYFLYVFTFLEAVR